MSAAKQWHEVSDDPDGAYIAALVAMHTPEGASKLHNYRTGAVIRVATLEEEVASVEAAERDDGIGAIVINGVTCYVQ